MKFQSLFLGAVFFAACTLVLPSHATVVIEDTFSGRYSSEESVKLSATHPNTAGTSLSWTATSNLVFKTNATTQTEYLTADGTANHANMSLPFTYNTYSSNGSVATVGITLNSGSSGSNDKWIGVGFSSASSFNNPISNGTVWLQISRRSTTANWYLKTKNTTLATGALGTDFSLSSSNTFSFSYDFATTTVTGVYLNGVNVLEAAYVFGAPGNQAAPAATNSVGAFFQWADNDVNKLTDFKVAMNTTSVPEPAAGH